MNEACQVCAERPAVHSHHRQMRSQGGSDERVNLLRVCAACHDSIHANPSDAYARGLLVHSWADPALVRMFLAPEKTDEKFETLVVTEKTWNEMAVHEGEPCPTCKRRVPHAKKATSPRSGQLNISMPLDEVETVKELVDSAAEYHGFKSQPHHRFKALLYGVVLLLQQEKGELPV